MLCQRATRWNTGPTTDLKYPNRNVLSILNGKCPSNIAQKSCLANLLKQLPCVSSDLEKEYNTAQYLKIYVIWSIYYISPKEVQQKINVEPNNIKSMVFTFPKHLLIPSTVTVLWTEKILQRIQRVSEMNHTKWIAHYFANLLLPVYWK